MERKRRGPRSWDAGRRRLLFHGFCLGSPQPAPPGWCHPSEVLLPQGPALGAQAKPRGAVKPGHPRAHPLHTLTHPHTLCTSPKTFPQGGLCFQEMLKVKQGGKQEEGEANSTRHHLPGPRSPQLTPRCLRAPACL